MELGTAVEAVESALTERQQYWLGHIRAAEEHHEPLKQYAQRKGVSEHSLYAMKRQLRKLGVIAAPPQRKGASRFARIVATPVARTASEPSFRIRFPNGTEISWAEAPSGNVLRELFELASG